MMSGMSDCLRQGSSEIDARDSQAGSQRPSFRETPALEPLNFIRKPSGTLKIKAEFSVFLSEREKACDDFHESSDQNRRNQRAFSYAYDMAEQSPAAENGRQDKRAVEKDLDGAEGAARDEGNGQNGAFAGLHERFGAHLQKDSCGQPDIADKTHDEAGKPPFGFKGTHERHGRVDKQTEDEYAGQLKNVAQRHGFAQQGGLQQEKNNVDKKSGCSESETRDGRQRPGNRADGGGAEAGYGGQSDADCGKGRADDEHRDAQRKISKGLFAGFERIGISGRKGRVGRFFLSQMKPLRKNTGGILRCGEELWKTPIGLHKTL